MVEAQSMQSEHEKGLRESQVRLSSAMLYLLLLKENVSHVISHVAKNLECVRDRLNEMENEMRVLSIDEQNQTNGGILPLIGALVTVFVLPKIINDHRKEYGDWGRGISQNLYDYNHPYDPNK
jgi:hypothetical protein